MIIFEIKYNVNPSVLNKAKNFLVSTVNTNDDISPKLFVVYQGGTGIRLLDAEANGPSIALTEFDFSTINSVDNINEIVNKKIFKKGLVKDRIRVFSYISAFLILALGVLNKFCDSISITEIDLVFLGAFIALVLLPYFNSIKVLGMELSGRLNQDKNE